MSFSMFQTASEMTQELTRRKDKLFKFGIRAQPIVVVVGDLSAPLATYVVVDDSTWKLWTPLKGAEVCFKAFRHLHASYPVESHAWLMLQRLAYDIVTKWDTVSSSFCCCK